MWFPIHLQRLKKEGEHLQAAALVSGTYEAVLSDGTKREISVEVPEDLELPSWTLEVEDWNEGEKKKSSRTADLES